jgi:CSLREA domain-containing protein
MRIRVHVAFATVAAACGFAAPAHAADFPVNSLADPGTGSCDVGECTLREAIAAASGNGSAEVDQIPIDVTGTINAASALPLITTPTTITGPGAGALTVRASAAGYGLFAVLTANAAHTVRIQGITIADASAPGFSDAGIGTGGPGLTILDGVRLTNNKTTTGAGAIHTSGPLTILNSTLDGNEGGFGGAVQTSGNAELRVVNSTIATNRAFEFGGGIYAGGANATVTLAASTVVGNKADADDSGGGDGGGVYNNASGGFIFGSFRIGNSILADNEVGGSQATPDYECAGNTFKNWGGNLRTTDDPDCTFTSPVGLGSLGGHGGPTPTVDLLPGSPAIDAGLNPTPSASDPFIEPCPATDQRGLPRGGINGPCDVGAFELQKPLPASAAAARTRCKKGFKLKKVKHKGKKTKRKCVKKKRRKHRR